MKTLPAELLSDLGQHVLKHVLLLCKHQYSLNKQLCCHIWVLLSVTVITLKNMWCFNVHYTELLKHFTSELRSRQWNNFVQRAVRKSDVQLLLFLFLKVLKSFSILETLLHANLRSNCYLVIIESFFAAS